VNAYYSQFETEDSGPAAAAEEPAESEGEGAEEPAVEPEAALDGEGAAAASGEPSEPEIPGDLPETGPDAAETTEESAEQFGTMEGAGSPTHNQPEGTGAPESGRDQ